MLRRLKKKGERGGRLPRQRKGRFSPTKVKPGPFFQDPFLDQTHRLVKKGDMEGTPFLGPQKGGGDRGFARAWEKKIDGWFGKGDRPATSFPKERAKEGENRSGLMGKRKNSRYRPISEKNRHEGRPALPLESRD